MPLPYWLIWYVDACIFLDFGQVLSIKLDEWTDEQVNALIDLGGNTAANKKYEAFMPDDYRKPRPDASTEERYDFIR
jgi:stromal membrane-associated protein